MNSKYNPKEFEDRIYQKWEETGSFTPSEDKSKEPFTIVLPPPNITGVLHMGHALNHAYQDILIRFKRLQGFNTLFLPGTDHASIATEVLILKMLKEQEGLIKENLTREEFLKRAWEWREKYGRTIVTQMKKLGDSCDWSRERFTMDEGCSDAVVEMFCRLYEKGLIYKGNRMVNWCCHDMTTISDAEVEHDERSEYLYYVKYPFVGEEGHLLVATSRPETIFGDVAVAVNPNDDTTKHYIGKKVRVPLHDREIPIIGDEAIEIGFGTGALKVTPAHDIVDYEIGIRHNLQIINTLNLDGTLNEHGRQYQGLTREEARSKMVQDLEIAGLLEKKETYVHNVGTCYRCGTVIEPVISDQWFVKMETLAKPALEVLKSKDLEFYPENYEKTYVHWLENIKDWNISRQLWWGHRIPAYECKSCKKIIVAKEQPDYCPHCRCEEFTQDEDVLDTWFSSALWPFSTLGWPRQTEDLKYYYPTSVLSTGYDIIFFWVVRMVFSSMEIMGQSPFKTVLINGLVRDKYGKKMSKSSGNGIDPLEVIENHGADALRFALIHGNSTGQDIRLYEEKFEMARNFANKLWNASRFVITNIPDNYESFTTLNPENLELSDKWILTKFRQVHHEVTKALEKYDFSVATAKLYDFVWSDYCDWYIELAKKRIYSEDSNSKLTVTRVLLNILSGILKLMHPFMPFITEEIWSYLPHLHTNSGMLITSSWRHDTLEFSEDVVDDMESIMNAIRSIRNIRKEMDIPNSRKSMCFVSGKGSQLYIDNQVYFASLCHTTEIKPLVSSEGTVSITLPNSELFLPLADLIDFEKEVARLTKEIENLDKEIDRIDKKLSNESFIAKAPESVVQEEKEKRAKYLQMKETVVLRLETFRK